MSGGEASAGADSEIGAEAFEAGESGLGVPAGVGPDVVADDAALGEERFGVEPLRGEADGGAFHGLSGGACAFADAVGEVAHARAGGDGRDRADMTGEVRGVGGVAESGDEFFVTTDAHPSASEGGGFADARTGGKAEGGGGLPAGGSDRALVAVE